MEDAALLARVRAVVEAAAALVRARAPTRADRKAHQDYVTDVDLAADALLERELSRLLPGVPVLSEERPADGAGSPAAYWIVDPVDGTGNLLAGLPFVGVSVALADASGPRLAAVSSVFERSVTSAIRGQGAWLGDRPLALPEVPPELIVLSTGALDAVVGHPEAWAALRRVGKLRNLGAQSLHLCGVAQGRFAAVASVEARIWDEAAAGLVLREAGGGWRSRADEADWGAPAAVMAQGPLRSLAAHPAVEAALALALAGTVLG